MIAADPDIALAVKWARFYRTMNLNPLPSIPGAKIPAMSTYVKERDNGLSDAHIARFWASGIQICTGSIWGLVVVDLDGWDAKHQFFHTYRNVPRTWTVKSRNGWHLWFSVPVGGDPIPHKTVLWQGEGKHNAIEVLGDKNLAVAPPTPFGPGIPGRYEFIEGLDPGSIARPSRLPDGIRPAVPVVPRRLEVAPIALMPLQRGHRPRGAVYDRDDVLDAIPDKLAVAVPWGLRVASDRICPRGFVRCHSIARDDRHPSASFNTLSGCYTEQGKLNLAFFDLAAILGAYPTWQDAVTGLGDQFIGRQHAG